jgi:hypothetical protein
LSKKGEAILSSLDTHNRNIQELLNLDKELDSMNVTGKYTPFADIFAGIKRQALNLHTALKAAWNCDCKTPHITALRLEKRLKGGWSSNFNVAFDIPESTAHPGVSREVKICIRQKSKDVEKVLETKSESSSRPDDWVDQLRGDFRSVSSPATNVTPPPVLPLPVSTPSSFSLNSVKSIFKKSNFGISVTSLSASNGSETLIHESQSKYVLVTPLTIGVSCCESLLIILEARYQMENQSRAKVWDFRRYPVTLEERS